jgi:hypothetical protein
MASLDNVLRQLREEHNSAQSEVEKLDKAISIIEGLSRSSGAANGMRPTRTISAAARRRIAQAQKARWAKLRRQSQTVATAKTNNAPRSKRRLSAEGRKRIAAAARARWARVRAQQAKKAA